MKLKLTILLSLLAIMLCVATFLMLQSLTQSLAISIPFTGALGATLGISIISNLMMYRS